MLSLVDAGIAYSQTTGPVTLTLPASEFWKINGFRGALVATATAGTRQLSLTFTPPTPLGGGTPYPSRQVIPPASVAASQTQLVQSSRSGGLPAAYVYVTGKTQIIVPWDSFFLIPLSTILLEDINAIDASDQLTISVDFERYLPISDKLEVSIIGAVQTQGA